MKTKNKISNKILICFLIFNGLIISAYSTMSSGYFFGNIGIGIITPEAMLDVNGKIYMRNLTQDNDPAYTVATKSYVDSNVFSGDYNDLINKPQNLSEFNNDLTLNEIDPIWESEKNQYLKISDTVNWDKDDSNEFSGDYDDLTNKPTKLSEFENDIEGGVKWCASNDRCSITPLFCIRSSSSVLTGQIRWRENTWEVEGSGSNFACHLGVIGIN